MARTAYWYCSNLSAASQAEVSNAVNGDQRVTEYSDLQLLANPIRTFDRRASRQLNPPTLKLPVFRVVRVSPQPSIVAKIDDFCNVYSPDEHLATREEALGSRPVITSTPENRLDTCDFKEEFRLNVSEINLAESMHVNQENERLTGKVLNEPYENLKLDHNMNYEAKIYNSSQRDWKSLEFFNSNNVYRNYWSDSNNHVADKGCQVHEHDLNGNSVGVSYRHCSTNTRIIEQAARKCEGIGCTTDRLHVCHNSNPDVQSICLTPPITSPPISVDSGNDSMASLLITDSQQNKLRANLVTELQSINSILSILKTVRIAPMKNQMLLKKFIRKLKSILRVPHQLKKTSKKYIRNRFARRKGIFYYRLATKF